jgi:hypothetical protein
MNVRAGLYGFASNIEDRLTNNDLRFGLKIFENQQFKIFLSFALPDLSGCPYNFSISLIYSTYSNLLLSSSPLLLLSTSPLLLFSSTVVPRFTFHVFLLLPFAMELVYSL